VLGCVGGLAVEAAVEEEEEETPDPKGGLQ